MAEEYKLQIEGTYLPVIRFGSGTKPLLILPGINLRGLEGQGHGLERAFSLFTSDFTVYVLDRRKCLSPNCTVQDMTRDVVFAMQALSIPQADVFGTSQGGMIAMQLALDYPEAAHKLILASTTDHCSESAERLFSQWLTYAQNGDVCALNRSFYASLFSEAFCSANRGALQMLESVGTKEDCVRFSAMVQACRTFCVTDRLSAIKKPTLVIGSEQDSVFDGRAVQNALARRIGCASVLYRQYGHAVYDEAPDFRKRVYDFLMDG